jgi:transcriptional regulator with XRE-family HTH domain
MTLLRIKPEDCSPLGKVVLKHMKENNMSLRELSKEAGITHPSLRRHCLGQGNPTESTLRKLSGVLGVHPMALYFLAYGDQIKSLEGEQKDDFFKPVIEAIDQIINRVPA